MRLEKIIQNENNMLEFGANLALACTEKAVIFLYGNLGAGKTTLVRGFLRGLKYEGAVKSPTYTIVEPYEINGKPIYHFDFYRVREANELEFIGVQDYFVSNAICLIEWPELGGKLLPESDVSCYIEIIKNDQRKIKLITNSEHGNQILNRIVADEEK
jgi:tRNA threonylcarbamoyladenosine biosynthesis protein TsaE